MSINHAIADARDAVVRTPARTFAIPSPRDLTLAGVARLADVLERFQQKWTPLLRFGNATIQQDRRRTPRAFANFPDHLLADMGYGRDWDGSIVPIVNDPKGWS